MRSVRGDMAGLRSPADVDATPVQHVTATPFCQSLLLEAPPPRRCGRGRHLRQTVGTTSGLLPGLAFCVWPVVSDTEDADAAEEACSRPLAAAPRRCSSVPDARVRLERAPDDAATRLRLFPNWAEATHATYPTRPRSGHWPPASRVHRRIRAIWVGSLRQREARRLPRRLSGPL
jgi:hypothetical protein